jgi:hypothetical protein
MSTNRNLNQQRIHLTARVSYRQSQTQPDSPIEDKPQFPHVHTPKQHRVAQTGTLLEQENTIKEEINHHLPQSNKNRKNLLHQNTQDLNVKLLFHLNTVPVKRETTPLLPSPST